jgi:hypothetical protein
MFTASPPTGSASNLIGGMLVNGFCEDYLWAWNYLWLWDCVTIVRWAPQLMEKFASEVMKLAEFTSSPLSAAPGLLQDVALAQSLLTNLSQLVARGSDIFPLDMLLGSKRGPTQREHLEKIREQTVKNLQTVEGPRRRKFKHERLRTGIRV